ncbi:unnamed protein product [Trifolium pratense]|uniref:Uncharacterized protein n=1 Tax=Trifolium pratense TaxID=57577 RepID=A0ACB0LKC9_TRIPR|nr:unnamed protein product [Trifolium pratense]
MAAFYFVSDNTTEELSIVHFQYPNNNNIKKISTTQIYKQSLFSIFNFLKPYKIITTDQNISIDKNKDVYLLSRDDIRSHRSNYNFLHIGLVQFSIFSNISTNQELNVSISLRDSKYEKFEDSILIRLDSECKGVVKFNWFPNFSTRLSDLANSNALVVTIDAPDSLFLKVRYRVCYKLMKKSSKAYYLFQNPILEVDKDKTNVVVVPKSNGT